MSKCLTVVSAGLFIAFLAGCTQNGQISSDPPLTMADPQRSAEDGQQSGEPKGEGYLVKFETSKGDFIVRVVYDWAPNGADRFEDLVKVGYYDDCRFFRVLDNFMAQVGVNGDPAVSARWLNDNIPDDHVLESNRRGYVTFATSGPDSRTTQFFINFKNNALLDAKGFSPIGKVIEGMDVVDSLYSGYGEGAPRGNGPDQGRVQAEGNEYLNREFPKLDYIKKATIIGQNE
jgi:peptidyl-prolyl cis-trans isomerase A (cyclophilin A)